MGNLVNVPRGITICRLILNGQLDVCVSRYDQTGRAMLCHEGWGPQCMVNPNRILYQLLQQSVHMLSPTVSSCQRLHEVAKQEELHTLACNDRVTCYQPTVSS